MRSPRSYEVVILGAGPAGASCAIALANKGVDRICLIDVKRPSFGTAVTIGETIPPDTCNLLDQLGVWPEFLDENHEPCFGSYSSWGTETLGFNDFVFNPHGCGWHLDRSRFDGFLLRRAKESGVEVRTGEHLLESELIGEQGYRLCTSPNAASPHVIETRFVVDATGRNSMFAKRFGSRQLELDSLTFLYGFFESENAASTTRLTLLEAVENGWWYAAGLPRNRLAVAFATDRVHIKEDFLGEAGRWLSRALSTRHLTKRLEGCEFLSKSLTARTVTSFALDKAAGPNWLAVGDAAACFDPLVAQGIYKAIADGISAAGHLTLALRDGTPFHDEYAESAKKSFNEYLQNRNHFYRLERRWPDSRFWQRRQIRTELDSAGSIMIANPPHHFIKAGM